MQRSHQTHSHNLHFKITELARRFNPKTVLRQDTLLLYNPKECRGKQWKGLSFLPAWIFQTSLSLVTPRLLINLPRKDSLTIMPSEAALWCWFRGCCRNRHFNSETTWWGLKTNWYTFSWFCYPVICGTDMFILSLKPQQTLYRRKEWSSGTDGSKNRWCRGQGVGGNGQGPANIWKMLRRYPPCLQREMFLFLCSMHSRWECQRWNKNNYQGNIRRFQCYEIENPWG